MLPWERNLSKDVGIIVSLSDNIGISATVVSVNHKDWISRHQGGERCGHLFSLCAPKISLWPNVPTGRTNLTSISEQCPRPPLLPRLLPISERCRTEICYLIGASGPFLKHRQIWCDDSLCSARMMAKQNDVRRGRGNHMNSFAHYCCNASQILNISLWHNDSGR